MDTHKEAPAPPLLPCPLYDRDTVKRTATHLAPGNRELVSDAPDAPPPLTDPFVESCKLPASEPSGSYATYREVERRASVDSKHEGTRRQGYWKFRKWLHRINPRVLLNFVCQKQRKA